MCVLLWAQHLDSFTVGWVTVGNVVKRKNRIHLISSSSIVSFSCYKENKKDTICTDFTRCISTWWIWETQCFLLWGKKLSSWWKCCYYFISILSRFRELQHKIFILWSYWCFIRLETAWLKSIKWLHHNLQADYSLKLRHINFDHPNL